MPTTRLLSGIGIAILLLAGRGIAGPLEGCEAAYERQDHAEAFRLCRPLAEQGNANAQTELGLMYEYGQDVAQDYTEAVKWYRAAADQGLAAAQYNLAGMYWRAEAWRRTTSMR